MWSLDFFFFLSENSHFAILIQQSDILLIAWQLIMKPGKTTSPALTVAKDKEEWISVGFKS